MDLSGIEIVKGEMSSLTWIPVDVAGERCIYMFPNVTGKITVLSGATPLRSAHQAAKHFHTEASQLPIVPVKEAMKIAKACECARDIRPRRFAQLFRASQSRHAGRTRRRRCKLVDVLKPCKAAARELTGEADYDKIATKLLGLGPKLVAVTMGAEGCMIATREKTVHVPAFKVNVVDTTGAGDAFMGGLSYGLLQGWEHATGGHFCQCLRGALLHESGRARDVEARRCGRVHQVEQPGGRAGVLASDPASVRDANRP